MSHRAEVNPESWTQLKGSLQGCPLSQSYVMHVSYSWLNDCKKYAEISNA